MNAAQKIIDLIAEIVAGRDKRIEELEARIEAAKKLAQKWRDETCFDHPTYTHRGQYECADELDTVLAEKAMSQWKMDDLRRYLAALETGDPDRQLTHPEDDVQIVRFAVERIEELKARLEAVKKCPVYFEGGVMTIGDDGLFPVGGTMTVVAVMQALKPGE